jgi:head-tail adaptor
MPPKIKTGSGDLNRKITIQRATTTYNAFNEPVNTWVDVMTRSAKRVDASDSQRIEYMAAAQVGAFTLARFTVRSDSQTRTIKATDRLLHEGAIWNIRGAKEADEGLHRFVEIMAAKDAG